MKVTVKNLRRLACQCDLDQSDRKSTQVHARPGWPNGLASRLAFTYKSVCPGFELYLQEGFSPHWLDLFRAQLLSAHRKFDFFLDDYKKELKKTEISI